MPRSEAPRPSEPRWRRELEDLDAVFSALAHPVRRHVLVVLHFRGGSMTAGRLAQRFACSWPTTSRHLKVLVDGGLVRVERRGRERVYHLERARLRAVVGDWLAAFSS